MQSLKLEAYRLVYSTRAPVYVSHNVDDDGQKALKMCPALLLLKDRLHFFLSLFTRVSQYNF